MIKLHLQKGIKDSNRCRLSYENTESRNACEMEYFSLKTADKVVREIMDRAIGDSVPVSYWEL